MCGMRTIVMAYAGTQGLIQPAAEELEVIMSHWEPNS